MDYAKESLKLHYQWKGKIEVVPRAAVTNKEELSLAYTPGVAQPCLEIKDNVDLSYELTRRWNLVAVVTDGTAVLGLGDIGPEAGMPVMEGKCVLFKACGDVDAFPLCVRSKDVDEIVRTISLISGSFGGINLEDIAAPRCFEIERKLKECTDIPIFHDDQHGTAVVCAAAVTNALKLVKKDLKDCTAVFSGAGAAGVAIAKLFLSMGIKDVIMCDRKGIICEGDETLAPDKAEVATYTNRTFKKGTLADAMKRIGLAERTGRGIDRIYEGSLLNGRLLPDYSRSTASRVVLFIPKGPTDKAFIRLVSAEQKRLGRSLPIYSLLVLNALKNLSRGSVHDIAEYLKIDETRVRVCLETMAGSGIVEAGGGGRGRYYLLGSEYYRGCDNSTEYVRRKDIDAIRHGELAMQLAKQQGAITRKDVMNLLHVTPPQAYRLLQKLAEEGKLALVGHGAGAKYIVK